jgi:hypothetical protein
MISFQRSAESAGISKKFPKKKLPRYLANLIRIMTKMTANNIKGPWMSSIMPSNLRPRNWCPCMISLTRKVAKLSKAKIRLWSDKT